MSQYNNFHKLYECFEVKEKFVSKPDRGTQTAPLTLIEKDTNVRSGLGSAICHLIAESVCVTLIASSSEKPIHPSSPQLHVSIKKITPSLCT